MYLKQIQVENFKSFARKTNIPLLQGYSAVTGPNGSGKSNIADAILFVLGPRSSRVIRAGKLTDLIFNGGKDKRPAKECKVSLVFDNSDRLIPIDASDVKLTRVVRLADNTEGYYSYFYVNDRRSTLGEFDNLLANARISADGYNFVQQGDITRIVEMSNLERRRILDDIAGITRFDEDIQKAEQERVQVEQNVERLSIIFDELKKQMRQLEADREGAMKYKDLHDKLSCSKAGLAVKRKDSVAREISSLNEQIRNYTDEKAKAESKRAELEEKLKTISQELTDVENELTDRGGEEAREIKEKIDNLRIEIARAKDACENAGDTTEELRELRKISVEDLKAVEKDLATIQEKVKPLQQVHDGKAKELESKRAELAKHQQEISKSDSEANVLQKELQKMNSDLSSKEEKLHALTLEQDRVHDKVSRLRIDIANLEENKKTYAFELKDAEWSIKELKGGSGGSADSIKKLQAEYQSKRNKERKLTEQFQDLENAVKTLTREYSQLKAEAEAADLVNRGYSSAVTGILEARDKGILKGVHGTVAELAEVEEKYSTALNVAAGQRMQSIIVDSDEVAASCISMLKKNKLGRATFLPLSKMIDGRPRGKAIMASKDAVGFAIDLIKFEDKYKAAFWYVFGDTVVVDSLGKARKLMGGVRLVTLEGELIEASGAMVGGTLEKNLGKFGAPSQSRIEKKAAELRAAVEQSEKIQAELGQLKSELTEIEARIHDTNAKDSTESVKISTLEAKRKEFKQKLDSLVSELETKNKELSDSLDIIAKTAQDIERFTKEIEKVKSRKEEKDKKLIEATPQELSKKLKDLQDTIFELSNEASQASSELQTASKQVEIVTSRRDEIKGSIQTIDAKVKEQETRAKENTAKQAELDTELKALQKMERSMGDKLNTLRTKRDSLYKAKTDTEADRDRLETKVQTSGDFVLSLQTKVAEAEKRLGEAEAELGQYAGVELPGKLPSVEELKVTVAECERHIGSLGAVNLKAIDEYEERRSRHEGLKDEISQLGKQKTNLIKLVDELNDKKTVGLLKIHGSINDNFRKIFSELSGGGEAELLLENEQDPLSGGLIIKARPKDKKAVRMEALSGGEKSLTALSFIFSIQAYQPSPFYMLDEVDMFLDGVNADNVARAIKRSSQNAQFIQISLRKVTLKEADHIIGVTMQREGISDLVMRPNIGDIVDVPAESEPGPEAAQEAG